MDFVRLIKRGIVPTLKSTKDKGSAYTPLLVSTQTNGTNTQHKSMKKTLEKDQTQETSQQLTLLKSPTTTYSQADFLARLSRLLGNGKDLKIHEALSSLISQGYSIPSNLDICFLKMSKDCFHIMTDIRSAPYSGSCQNWGMTYNGKFSIQSALVCPRIGKECSLSDILEDQVDQKYFLSDKATQGIIRASQMIKSREQFQQDLEKE